MNLLVAFGVLVVFGGMCAGMLYDLRRVSDREELIETDKACADMVPTPTPERSGQWHHAGPLPVSLNGQPFELEHEPGWDHQLAQIRELPEVSA